MYFNPRTYLIYSVGLQNDHGRFCGIYPVTVSTLFSVPNSQGGSLYPGFVGAFACTTQVLGAFGLGVARASARSKTSLAAKPREQHLGSQKRS